jgi:hypothetical protein
MANLSDAIPGAGAVLNIFAKRGTQSPTPLDVQVVSMATAFDVNDNPTAFDPARDGTDATDANATQATGGFGLRGWASTGIALFRSGMAKVSIRLLTATDVVTLAKVYTPIQTEATTNTRTATGGTNAYQTVIVPIVMPAGFNPTELGLAGTIGPLAFATNGAPAGQVQLNLECQDASGRWTGIWNSGAVTTNAGTASYPSASLGSGMQTPVCFTNTLRWNYVFTGTFTNATLTEQMTIWGK